MSACFWDRGYMCTVMLVNMPYILRNPFLFQVICIMCDIFGNLVLNIAEIPENREGKGGMSGWRHHIRLSLIWNATMLFPNSRLPQSSGQNYHMKDSLSNPDWPLEPLVTRIPLLRPLDRTSHIFLWRYKIFWHKEYFELSGLGQRL